MNKTLAEVRAESGYTQEEMSKALGIGISTYNQYETGARNIPVDKVKRISSILNIEEKDFFVPLKFTLSKIKKDE
ncbi:MAG: hypothetical protein EUB_02616 [Eubacterium sp.]|uniref:helix-turn-helix domain-containing protein n=1 Tax=Eubacterium sp. TaxID=142586 RepID=UPI0030627B40